MFYKKYSDNVKCSRENSAFTFSVLMGVVAAAIVFCLSGLRFNAGALTFSLGAVQALIFFVYNLTLMKAMTGGASYSLLSICSLSGAILIPLVETSVFFGNYPEGWKLIPIGMILVSFILLNLDGLSKDGDRRYIIFYIAMFFINGIYNAMLDVHQKLSGGTEKTELMIVSYLLSALFALIFMWIKDGKIKFSEFAQTPRSAAFLLLCSAISATSIYAAVYLLDKFNAAVVYALTNGGTLVVATIYSVIFLKEKMPLSKVIGIIVAIAGIVILSVR